MRGKKILTIWICLPNITHKGELVRGKDTINYIKLNKTI